MGSDYKRCVVVRGGCHELVKFLKTKGIYEEET